MSRMRGRILIVLCLGLTFPSLARAAEPFWYPEALFRLFGSRPIRSRHPRSRRSPERANNTILWVRVKSDLLRGSDRTSRGSDVVRVRRTAPILGCLVHDSLGGGVVRGARPARQLAESYGGYADPTLVVTTRQCCQLQMLKGKPNLRFRGLYGHSRQCASGPWAKR